MLSKIYIHYSQKIHIGQAPIKGKDAQQIFSVHAYF